MTLKITKDFHDRIEYIRISAGSIIERDDARAAVLIAAGVAAEPKPEPEISEKAAQKSRSSKKSSAKK